MEFHEGHKVVQECNQRTWWLVLNVGVSCDHCSAVLVDDADVLQTCQLLYFDVFIRGNSFLDRQSRQRHES